MIAPSPELLTSTRAADKPARRVNAEPLPGIRLGWRTFLTLGIFLGYYSQKKAMFSAIADFIKSWIGQTIEPTTIGVGCVAGLIVAMVFIWRPLLARDKRFHAPLLITCILIMGDAAFSILENHSSTWLAKMTDGVMTSYSPTFFAIATTVLTELTLGRFFYGKWPHLGSAYVSGISAGILIKSPDLWPFIFCGAISISSKYVLRIGERHLWNPTNFGMTMMLLLAPQHVASLSVQAGNGVWSVVVIWAMGGMILWQLKRLHISLAFVLAFIPLAGLRSWITGNPWLTEVTPITSPMFQLYIFFMITDPKTTTHTRKSQILVAVLVAVMETFYRLAFRDIHSLYHALFTVGPIANIIEMIYFPKVAKCPVGAPQNIVTPQGAALRSQASEQPC